jgi:hypothetical protein
LLQASSLRLMIGGGQRKKANHFGKRLPTSTPPAC